VLNDFLQHYALLIIEFLPVLDEGEERPERVIISPDGFGIGMQLWPGHLGDRVPQRGRSSLTLSEGWERSAFSMVESANAIQNSKRALGQAPRRFASLLGLNNYLKKRLKVAQRGKRFSLGQR
jgi:hypothetical protein